MSDLTATPEATPLFAGAGLADDLQQMAGDLQNQNWLAAGLMTIPTGLDLLATAADPLGALIAAGLGWLQEHFKPPKQWLDQLAGDPAQVNANAETCHNVAREIRRLSAEVVRSAKDLAQTMSGDAHDAAVAAIENIATAMAAIANSHDGLGTSLTGAASVVTIVRGLVRDAISQIVASILSYVAELAVSLGLATPWVISQASSKVAAWTAKLGGKLKALIESHSMLKALLERVGSVWTHLEQTGKALHGEMLTRSGFAPGVDMHILPAQDMTELLGRLSHNAGPLARQSLKDFFLKMAIEHPHILVIDSTGGAHNSVLHDTPHPES